MPREFLLPDLGEGIAEAQIIRLMIKEGDMIKEDQYLMEVETDKAAVEIPSPYAGVAKTVHVTEGQTVNVGTVIVSFDDGDEPVASKVTKEKSKPAKSVSAPAKKASPAIPALSPPTTAAAAPAVRKLARELGIGLDAVTGTGPGGRVTKADIERHANATPESVPSSPVAGRRSLLPQPLPGVPDVDKWGPIRRDPLNQIRKTIAKRMTQSAFTIPHVTHSDEADITALDQMRRDLNQATGNDPKLTLMTFVIRAVCLSLRKFPIFNASFDEEGGQIIYKDYVNMGIAVDSQRGLIVPVIRQADQLSLRQIAGELRSLAERIRSNRFALEDLRGGTFTITNVGALGGMVSTPIINYPEVAILGLGRSRKVPVVRNDEIVRALTLPINLSFDHRATDGANAARFAGEIMNYLQTPGLFLLD